MVEANLAKKEQELLDMLLMQQQSTLATADSVALMRRLEAAEAEAAVSGGNLPTLALILGPFAPLR